MMKFMYLIHSISYAIEQKKILIVEGMDMGLHPNRLVALIDRFARNNTSNTQIIATMYNSSIMNFVRPDQIYLIDKIRDNEELKTKLTHLSL